MRIADFKKEEDRNSFVGAAFSRDSNNFYYFCIFYIFYVVYDLNGFND